MYLLTSSRLLVLLLYLRLGIIISAANSTLYVYNCVRCLYSWSYQLASGTFEGNCIVRILALLVNIGGSGTFEVYPHDRLVLSYRRLRYFVVSPPCYYHIGGSSILCCLYFRRVLLYQRLRYFVVSPPCIIISAATLFRCIPTLFKLRYLHNIVGGGSMHVFGSLCVTVKAIL